MTAVLWVIAVIAGLVALGLWGMLFWWYYATLRDLRRHP